MYLVLMIQHDRVIHVQSFRNFDQASFHADSLVMDQRGVTNDMPDWENSEYRTVFTSRDGISIMIEPCNDPEQADKRFQCHKYGVNAE